MTAATPLLCALSYLFVEFHSTASAEQRTKLMRYGLREDLFEALKGRVHAAMEQPGCKLQVYWRSFWASCGDQQRCVCSRTRTLAPWLSKSPSLPSTERLALASRPLQSNGARQRRLPSSRLNRNPSAWIDDAGARAHPKLHFPRFSLVVLLARGPCRVARRGVRPQHEAIRVSRVPWATYSAEVLYLYVSAPKHMYMY